jgi:WD40 repeat protein
VWGLGAIFYELLCGRPPFKGADVLDTLSQVREKEPARPRSICEFVDRDLETVCLKCLEKEPLKRFGSAEALADELERWVRGEPLRVRPVSGFEQAWRWCKRKPAWATVVAITLLAVVATIAGLAVSRLLIGNALRDKAAAFDKLAGEQARTKQALDDLDLSFRREKEISYARVLLLADREIQANRLADARALLDSVRAYDQRGWEWDYLTQVADPKPLWTLGGRYFVTLDTDRVYPTFHRGNSRVALVRHPDPPVGKPHPVVIVDTATGKVVQEVVLTDVPHTAVLSPDATRLAVMRTPQQPPRDGTEVAVWELHPVRKVFSVFLEMCECSPLTFSPDGTRIVGGVSRFRLEKIDAGSIRKITVANDLTVWDARSGAEVRRIPSDEGFGHVRPTFSPDGRFVLADRKKWEVATGTRSQFNAADYGISRPSGGVTAAIVKRYPRGEIAIRDAATGRDVRMLPLAHAGPEYLAYSSDGRRLAVLVPGAVVVLDPETGAELTTLSLPRTEAEHITFGPDDKTLIVTEKVSNIVGEVILSSWDLDKLPAVRVFRECGSTLAVSADGRRIATGAPKAVVVRDAATGAVVHSFDNAADRFRWGLAFSPDGRYLAAGNDDRFVQLWDLRTGMPHRAIELPRVLWAQRVAFRPDSRQLTVGFSGGFATFDVESGELLHDSASDEDTVAPPPVAYSPDGGRMLTSCSDGSIWLWDANRKETVFRRNLHAVSDDEPGWIYSVGFLKDGKRFITCCDDRTARIWGENGEELVRFAGHTSTVTEFAISPDERRLATASRDASIKIWDVASGRELLTLRGHTGAVTGLAWSPDGRTIYSTSDDGSLRFWTSQP